MVLRTDKQRKRYFADKNKPSSIINETYELFNTVTTLSDLKEGNVTSVFIDGVFHNIPAGSVVVMTNKGLKILGKNGMY